MEERCGCRNEYMRERPVNRVDRKLGSREVIETATDALQRPYSLAKAMVAHVTASSLPPR